LPKFDKHTQRFYKHITYLLRAGTHRLKPGVKKLEGALWQSFQVCQSLISTPRDFINI
jgi:hypothetical protein